MFSDEIRAMDLTFSGPFQNNGFNYIKRVEENYKFPLTLISTNSPMVEPQSQSTVTSSGNNLRNIPGIFVLHKYSYNA